jgi:hypothetical protein
LGFIALLKYLLINVLSFTDLEKLKCVGSLQAEWIKHELHKFGISQVQVEDFVCVCHVEVVTESRRSDDLCEVDTEFVTKIGVSSDEIVVPFE